METPEEQDRANNLFAPLFLTSSEIAMIELWEKVRKSILNVFFDNNNYEYRTIPKA